MTDSFLHRMRLIFGHRRGLRLLAIVMAVCAWYAIRQATSHETVIKDLPIEVITPEGWAVLERSSTRVDVLFSGTLNDLRYLDRDDISVEVRPPNLDEATDAVLLKLTARNVRYQGGSRVVRLEPSEIRVRLDREQDLAVPVTVDLLGSPPEGIEVVSVTCTPSKVLLHAPGQRLRDIKEIKTEPVELAGRVRSFQLERGLQDPAKDWSARMEPGEVRVAVSLVEKRVWREVTNIAVRPIAIEGASGVPTVMPSHVSVRFEGDPVLLEKLTADLILAVVDSSVVPDGGSAEVPVRVSAPPGIRALAVQPAMARVQRGSIESSP